MGYSKKYNKEHRYYYSIDEGIYTDSLITSISRIYIILFAIFSLITLLWLFFSSDNLLSFIFDLFNYSILSNVFMSLLLILYIIRSLDYITRINKLSAILGEVNKAKDSKDLYENKGFEKLLIHPIFEEDDVSSLMLSDEKNDLNTIDLDLEEIKNLEKIFESDVIINNKKNVNSIIQSIYLNKNMSITELKKTHLDEKDLKEIINILTSKNIISYFSNEDSLCINEKYSNIKTMKYISKILVSKL